MLLDILSKKSTININISNKFVWSPWLPKIGALYGDILQIQAFF